MAVFAQAAPPNLPECVDAKEVFGNHQDNSGYFVDQPLPVEHHQDLTDPQVSRLCFPNPDLVLVLSCQPLNPLDPQAQINKPAILQQSLWAMYSFAASETRTNIPGHDDNSSIVAAQEDTFLKNGICMVDRGTSEQYVEPKEDRDQNFPGACVTVEQGTTEQQTTFLGVKQISQVLQVVADNRVVNREAVNSCTYVVTNKVGGGAVAKGCFLPFRESFFNLADKSIHVTCP